MQISLNNFFPNIPIPFHLSRRTMVGRVDPQKRPLALPYMPPAYAASLLFRLGKRVELQDMPGVDYPMGSSLIALALVIRSRDGPRFVFHYPPRPSENQIQDRRVLWGTELQFGELFQVEDEEEDEDIEYTALNTKVSKLDLSANGRGKSKEQEKANHVDDEAEDYHYDKPSGEHVVPWETIFDFPTTDLESILTPSKAYHKKRFELSIDSLIFVSHPIHIREDGTWDKKKAKKNQKAKAKKEDEISAAAAEGEIKPTASKDIKSEEDEDGGGMTMFNVVFVLDVPNKKMISNHLARIYDYVVKDFNKALLHAQASSNYVWKESEMILAMKEKGRDERTPMSKLWTEILLHSSLAGAIRDVFNAISKDNIATVHLPAKRPIDLSLQIYRPTFISAIPSLAERGIPGVLVTSADPCKNEEGVDDPEYLNKHFGLLLLDDENTIISEIQAENSDSSGPLIECIKICKPTMSFLQVAQTNSIDLVSLLLLAQHLIYWRRAIAYPPLHARNEYIVSPNCDTRKLPEASVAWKTAFPLAPSLSGFLAELVAPRPYKTFAPSKDHRPKYLDMLAWLVRGAWVTQLRTFCWILVWPEIVYEVRYKLKAEAIEEAKNPNKSHSGSSETNGSADDSGTADADSDTPLTTEQLAEKARLQRLAEKRIREEMEDAAAFKKLPIPIATEHPSINNADHLEDIAPYIITDPHKVSNEESLFMKAIGDRFKDPKAKEWWPRLTKYFNGEEALEEIALKENMKRKEMMNIINIFNEHQLRTRHF